VSIPEMILGNMGEGVGLLSSTLSNNVLGTPTLITSSSMTSPNSMSLAGGPPSPTPILPSFGFTQEQVNYLKKIILKF
jgi:hypothetical protein